ncbi:LacI family DNA-binding transcriptional regulator [Nocardiopsis suaedae]|uniref:LacI family DNA-binding transcriptional regulator n=1 Tax=Nocardiopsis suaedae TaxID=3018444 RepID=A0ABT4TFF1_9ACTN|nr:LacI family DNA-binding transcriptional regulator [Nocardiopsis suaedae]MDA2803440.1 LacI family DNA-binding transcriptional regulator [Nocardiopsis suaedae]
MSIADVARHAGVSPSTVSYVLSGKRSISEDTRRRVQESIRVLGYRPHAGARALASSRSNTLALVVPLRSDVHVPVAMRFAVSVVTGARDHDHDVLLLTQAEGADGLRRVAGSSMVDAIIVMDVEIDDARIPVLRELGLPAVLIGVPADTDGLACVDLDFTEAGRLCVQHLAGLGHGRLAFVGEPPAVYERRTGFAERTLAGFREAARELGVPEPAVLPCEPTRAAAERAAADLLRDHPGTTGLVVQNEAAAEPLVAALRAAGRSVPGDLSVVAIGADDVAAAVAPALSSVGLPVEELAERAVELAVRGLDDGTPAGVTLLAPTLVDRSSTAPPPRRA